MKRALSASVLALCFVCSGTCFSADLSKISGTWVLDSIYRTQNIQGPGIDEQKSLLGTFIRLTSSSLEACGHSVPVKFMETRKVSAREFLANTGSRFKDVGIKVANVTEIVINNRQSGTCFGSFPIPGQDIYVKGEREILIDFEGVFYRAAKVR